MKIFLFICLFFEGNAQNIVLNPNIDFDSTGSVSNWSFPFGKHPRNNNGNLLFTLSEAEGDDAAFHTYKHIDYLQGEFSTELSADSLYYFEAQMKRKLVYDTSNAAFYFYGTPNSTDTSHVVRLVASNNFGFLVLDKKITSNRLQDMPYLKQVVPDFNTCNLISLDGQWQKVSGYFRPKKSGSFFLLGNFYTTKHTKFSVLEDERKSFFVQTKNITIKDEREAMYFIKGIVVRSVKKNDLNDDNCINEKSENLECFFDFGRSNISAKQRRRIELFASKYQDSIRLSFRVLGYADSIGSFVENKKLSYERAENVKKYLEGLLAFKPDFYVYGVGEYSQGPTSTSQKKVVVEVVRPSSVKASEVYTAIPRTSDAETINGRTARDSLLGSLSDFPYSRIRKKLKSGYAPSSAKSTILRLSKDVDILFIGESHSMPEHRKFLMAMLPELKRQGFQSLFVETLVHDLPKEQKYLRIADGYFSREPNFGNLIRRAIELGFEVKSYDPIAEELAAAKLELERLGFFEANVTGDEGQYMEPDGTWRTLDDGFKDFTIRNYGEAVNLLAKMKGKIIVYGGVSHNEYFKCGLQTDAGYWLKELSSKSILSISQSTYYYDSLQLMKGEPVVLIKARDVVGPERYCQQKGGSYKCGDISVFHAQLSENDKKIWGGNFYLVNKPKVVLQYPVVLCVYYEDESPKDAVPVFTRIFNSRNELVTSPIVFRPTEKMQALVRDSNGLIIKVKLASKIIDK